MLDIEVIVPPTETGLDIVSLAEMRKHLRIHSSNTTLDDQITDAIIEAADKLHGIDGELNRAIFPTTFRRYLRYFPRGRRIRLPYPPLIEVLGFSYENGDSPTPAVSAEDYVVRRVDAIWEIQLLTDLSWPAPISRHPRAVWVDYQAGYTEYPPKMKRMVKILAAHYIENPEATITDRTQSMVSRKVEFGLEDLRTALRIPVSHDDWCD